MLGSGGRLWAALFGLVVSLAAATADAEEHVYIPYSGIISGTVGADPVELLVENATGTVMVCTAALAHWYSEALGRVDPGQTLAVMLWHDPTTGVINLLNASENRMPVEAVWCGAEGDLTQTRTHVGLPFATGPAASRFARRCSATGAKRWACEAVPGD